MGQPGKIKITGFLERGGIGAFAEAVALSELTGQPAEINAVRHYNSRPGASLNLERQVTETLGVFARAGRNEQVYEGKYVIQTEEPNLSAVDAVRLYKELSEVERAFADLKDVID